MNTGIVCSKTVCTDSVYSSSESALSKNNGKDHCKDQHQEKDVGNLSHFSADQTETVRICNGNTSSVSQNDLGNTTEDDLCCQSYDHRRKLLKSRKDESVDGSAYGSYDQRSQYDYDKRALELQTIQHMVAERQTIEPTEISISPSTRIYAIVSIRNTSAR